MTFQSPAAFAVRPQRPMSSFVRLVLAALIPLAIVSVQTPHGVFARERCFDEIASACISGRLLEFWEANGGLPVFGYPLGNAASRTTPEGTFLTQYFERARFELHPEKSAPYDVLLGRVGAERLEAVGGAGGEREEQGGTCASWAETGHRVCGAFLASWRASGLEMDRRRGSSEAESLALWGYPLTPMLSDGASSVQWFERARFELRGGAVSFGLLGREIAPPGPGPAQAPTPSPSTGVVISQVYGGGGNRDARLRNDFIELYNLGRAEVDMTGWSVQYADADGAGWLVTPISGFLFPGQHYLIQQAGGGGGTESLPSPDATGNISINQSSGKVALSRSTARLGGQCPKDDPSVVDFVGYGTANCFEGSGPAPQQDNLTAVIRRGEGSVETNDNQNDFVTGTPTPRNSGSPFVPTPAQTPTPIVVTATPVVATQTPVVVTATPGAATATPEGPSATPGPSLTPTTAPPTSTPQPTSGPPPPPPVPSAPFPQAPCDRNVPDPANGLQVWMADAEPTRSNDAVACVRLLADNAPVNGANAVVFRYIGDGRVQSIPQSTGLDGVASFIFYIGELPRNLLVPVEAVVSFRGQTLTAYTSFTTR